MDYGTYVPTKYCQGYATFHLSAVLLEMLGLNKNVSNKKSSIKLKIYDSKMHFKTAHVFLVSTHIAAIQKHYMSSNMFLG